MAQEDDSHLWRDAFGLCGDAALPPVKEIECPVCGEIVKPKVYKNTKLAETTGREKFYELAYSHVLTHAVHLQHENKRLKAMLPVAIA